MFGKRKKAKINPEVDYDKLIDETLEELDWHTLIMCGWGSAPRKESNHERQSNRRV